MTPSFDVSKHLGSLQEVFDYKTKDPPATTELKRARRMLDYKLMALSYHYDLLIGMDQGIKNIVNAQATQIIIKDPELLKGRGKSDYKAESTMDRRILTAVFDDFIYHLYSLLDMIPSILKIFYKKQGVSLSTSTFNDCRKSMSRNFPESAVANMFEEEYSRWIKDFREFRAGITHFDPSFCAADSTVYISSTGAALYLPFAVPISFLEKMNRIKERRLSIAEAIDGLRNELDIFLDKLFKSILSNIQKIHSNV